MEKENTQYKIHDALFKDALSYPSEVKKLIKAYIPAAIVEQIDWTTLKACKTNFVSEQLAQNFSDVVYKCHLLDKKTYLYFIFESQTNPDFYFPHRLEKYRLFIIDDHLKTEKSLPYIYAICLYSGSQPFKVVDYPNPKLKTLFNPLFNPFNPWINLIHLSQQQDAFLAESGVFQILLKLGSQPNKKGMLGWIKAHVDYVAKVLTSPYKYTGFSYLLELEKRTNQLAVLENLLKLLPEHSQIIMSAAQQLRQEGIEIGIFTKAIEIAKSMLLKFKIDIDTVQEATKLPKAELEKILQENK